MENKKKLDLTKKINIKNETQIKCVVVMYMYYYCALYLFDLSEKIPRLWPTRWFTCGLYILITIPVVLAHKKWGAYKMEKPDFKAYRQYIYGLLTIIPYYGVKLLVVGPAGTLSFPFLKMHIWEFLWFFFYYAIVVAVTEEYVFRIFFQGELTRILGKAGWLAPFICAVLFALAHVPQGYIQNVYIAFGGGLILGYARYFIKDYSFISLVMAHGLYDFLLVILL